MSLSIVCAGRNIPSVTGPVGVDKFAWGRQKLIGVGTEVITLGLNEIGWSTFRAEAVKEGQGRAECWSSYAGQGSLGHHLTPRVLALQDFSLEEVIKEKVGKFAVLVEGFFDVTKEKAVK